MSTPSGPGRKKPARGTVWKPGDSFRAFGECVIAERIARMLSHARAVRRGTDPEAVHDMRVASRRLRAALAVFEPAFRHSDYYRLEKEVKQLTDSLSRARDLDVMIEELSREAANMPASQRGVIGDIVRDWSVERRRIQGDVVAALDRLAEKDPMTLFDRARSSVVAEVGPEPEALADVPEPSHEARTEEGEAES